MAKTALDLTPEEWKAYQPRRTHAHPIRRTNPQVVKRRRLAWRVARRAATLLKEEYGATRVVVFGSLAHRAWFHARSDIDLAVEGLQPGIIWRAWSVIERSSPDFEIDLIEMETATDSLRQRIQEYGKEL